MPKLYLAWQEIRASYGLFAYVFDMPGFCMEVAKSGTSWRIRVYAEKRKGDLLHESTGHLNRYRACSLAEQWAATYIKTHTKH